MKKQEMTKGGSRTRGVSFNKQPVKRGVQCVPIIVSKGVSHVTHNKNKSVIEVQ